MPPSSRPPSCGYSEYVNSCFPLSADAPGAVGLLKWFDDTPYTVYHLELGEITSFPPGYKENAGVFCHNNPWIMIAETVLGNGERAFELYKKIAPAYIEDISDIHRTEPYVYSQMIAGRDAPRAGEAKNSWLTGTAAWNYCAISQNMLGIRPDFDGLVIDPCISSGTGLPKSDVLYFELPEDTWFCIRPSGTEPKIKLYMGVKGVSQADADERLERLKEAVLELVG